MYILLLYIIKRKVLEQITDDDVTNNNKNNPVMSAASHAAVNGNIRTFINFLIDNNIRIGMYYFVLLIITIISILGADDAALEPLVLPDNYIKYENTKNNDLYYIFMH